MEFTQIQNEAQQVVLELLEQATLQPGDILVVGCSSSEIIGETIGKCSSYQAAEAVVSAILPLCKEKGIYLAGQCCEHLNRAIIIEKNAVSKNDIVCVKPQPKAGGSFATALWEALEHPVAVEHIQADAGIDIGDTLIGMHLHPVAVPVRISQKTIGKAHIVCARTRPKYIGGARAHYPDNQ